jgi:hypothetical protein
MTPGETRETVEPEEGKADGISPTALSLQESHQDGEHEDPNEQRESDELQHRYLPFPNSGKSRFTRQVRKSNRELHELSESPRILFIKNFYTRIPYENK